MLENTRIGRCAVSDPTARPRTGKPLPQPKAFCFAFRFKQARAELLQSLFQGAAPPGHHFQRIHLN